VGVGFTTIYSLAERISPNDYLVWKDRKGNRSPSATRREEKKDEQYPPMLRRKSSLAVRPNEVDAEYLTGDSDISFDGGETWFHLFGSDCLEKLPRLILSLPVSQAR
jgi:hypothetical protein